MPSTTSTPPVARARAAFASNASRASSASPDVGRGIARVRE
jgi:hypothetical protein